MRRIKWIESIRGIGCLIVLIAHIIATDPQIGIYASGCGKIGVWLFMLLSGFLLVLPYAAEDRTFQIRDLPHYYLKKFVRLIPPFLAALLLGVAIRVISIGDVKTVLLLQGAWGHFWYMPVVLKFYFIAPAFLFIISFLKRKLKANWRIAAAIVFAVLVVHLFIVFPFGAYPENSIELKWYLGVFIIGMTLALFYPNLSGRKSKWMDWFVPIGIAMILIVTPLCREKLWDLPPSGYLQNKYWYMSAAWSLVLIGITGGERIRGLLDRCAFLQFVGKISYEVYLIHFLVLMALGPVISSSTWLRGGATVIISVVLGFVLQKVRELTDMRIDIRKRFLATLIATVLLFAGVSIAEAQGESMNSEEQNRLYVPTMINKIGEDYFIVDCWQNRVIYSDSLVKPLNEWKQLTDEEYIGGHTVCSDGELLVLDNTENSQVLVYRKADDGYTKEQVFENTDGRPHYVTYDAEHELFYVISSNNAKIFVFRNVGGVLKLQRIEDMPELVNSYVRSISIIDGELYTVSGPGAIGQYQIFPDHFELTGLYPVPANIAGMNQISKIGQYYYITVNTNSEGSVEATTILRVKDLEKLASDEWEDLYQQMGFVGQPYFITEFDDSFFISEISADRGNGIKFIRIIDDQICNVQDLFFWEDVTEASREIHQAGEQRKRTGQWVDLIVFAGQSNMAGKGESENAPIAKNGFEFRAVSDPTRLYPAEEPFGLNENREGGINHVRDGVLLKTGGLVTSFMNAYTEVNNVPVIGVSASEGNTVISQWIPGSDRYEDMVSRIEAAKSWLDESPYTIRNVFFVWCQGESDGDAGTTKEEYGQMLDQLMTAMKESAGVRHCFIIEIGERIGEGANDYHEIREAQEEYCKNHDDCSMIASFYDMRDYHKDVYHYTQEGYNIIGEKAGENAGLLVLKIP